MAYKEPAETTNPVLVFAITSTAINYTVLTTDSLIKITSTAAVRTMTLPSAASATVGHSFTFEDASGGALTHNIVIQPVGGQTIDGQASISINVNYGAVSIYSNGSNWFIWRN